MPLVLDGATVVDVEHGKLVPSQRVVIAGDRIRSVGDAGTVKVPQGARVVDARGKYLMPGLWDMHAHIDTTLGWYSRFVGRGVTGIREMAQRFAGGADSFRVWQGQVVTGTRVGPRSVGPSVDLAMIDNNLFLNVGPLGAPVSAIIARPTPERAAHIVDSLKTAGVAFLKWHGEMADPPFYYALMRESRRVDLPVVGHAPVAAMTITSVQVADSGQRSIEHFPVDQCLLSLAATVGGTPAGADSAAIEEKCAPVAAAYVRNGTWLVPTLAMHYRVAMRGLQPQLKFYLRLVRRHGVTTFLAGSDVSQMAGKDSVLAPGFSLLEEVMLLADPETGLTPLEALQTGTLNPAKFFHAIDSMGTVASGKLADLVLLDGNPLADIHNIAKTHAVVANGRYFDRAALDSLDPIGRKLAEGLVASGGVRQPGSLGIRPGSSPPGGGIAIGAFLQNSAAQAAGLRVGDVIVAVDDQPATSPTQMMEYARSWYAGRTLKIEFTRSGVRQTVNVKLLPPLGAGTGAASSSPRRTAE